MYDSQGRLLVSIKGIYSIIGNDTGNTELAEMAWQPLLATENAKCLEELSSLIAINIPDEGNEVPTPTAAQVTHCPNLALFVQSMATKKKQAMGKEGGPCVLRIMEFIQDASITSMVPALACLEGMAELDVIIEVYAATHDASIVNSISVMVPTEANKWLRTRIACLPLAMTDLKDFAFDVFLFSDWSNSGQKPWATSDDAINFAWGLACPGAILMAQGLVGEKDVEDYETNVNGYADAVKVMNDGAIIAARFEADGKGPRVAEEHRRILMIGSDEALAKQMSDCLIAAASPAKLSIHVLLCGPGHALNDQSTQEDWVAALTPYIADDQEGPFLEDMIFLDGLTDESNLAADAYYRLLALACGGHECFGAKKPGFDPVKLWILTTGVFCPPIHVGRASLYGVSRHIEFEMKGIYMRYVDLSGLECLPELAALIASRPTERTYKISHGQGPLVQRYNSVSSEQLATKKITADDPHDAYYCDVVRERVCNPGQVCISVCNIYV